MAKQSSHSCSLVTCVACCLLIAWCNSAYCQDVEIAAVSLPIDAADLPKDRLPTPTRGWPFANTLQHAGYRLNVTEGVLELIIQHRLIPGVTADAVFWLYRNLHRSVYKPSVNATALSVPLFQLLHPVDHLSFSCSTCKQPTSLIGQGSELDWIELQMTKCRQGRLWNCSDAATGKDRRIGFKRGDDATLAKSFLPTKVTSTVKQLDIKGYKATGAAQGYTISYVGHDFSNATTAQGVFVGLNATTTIRIGLLNKDYKFDTTNFAFGGVNAAVKSFLQSNTNVKSMNRVGTGMLLHSIQEWQNLRNWLQPVWAANKAKMPADV